MGVNWVFNGLNRCFGHSIGSFGPKQTQIGPKQTLRPHQTSENLLARWLVDLLACWLDLGAKKKVPYSHEPGTFEFYE